MIWKIAIIVISVVTVTAGSNAFLKTLVETPGGVVIAYGTDASSLTAANTIRDAIRAIPGQSGWSNMQAAASFDALPFRQTGTVHVIAVGMLKDNVVLRGRNWLPTWWMDWDWYNASYTYRLPRDKVGISYQSNSGFTAAGYGTWASGEARVGLIEIDRSHLFMEWMVRSRIDSASGGPVPGSGNFKNSENTIQNMGPVADHEVFTSKWLVYPKDFPLRLIVRVTGSGDQGVIAAATAFANNSMLSGVVLNGASVPAGPAPSTLSASRYATSLPFTPPVSSNNYTCIGWLLPDAFEYDGLTLDCGIRPVQIYRVKYKPNFGIVNFWTTPHRRAGEFEIAALKFTSATEAATAANNLDLAARALQPFKDGRITNWGIVRNGQYVYVQSMVNPAGAAILALFSSIGSW